MLRRKVFQNEIVMAHVAKYLPAKDLLSLRQTCPEWNATFVPELREKHTPITLSMSEDHPGASTDSESTISLDEYSSLMRSSRAIPFTKYQIYDLTSRTGAFKDFFKVCGSLVRSLTLDTLTVGINLVLLKAAVFGLTPNLVELELCIDSEKTPVSAKIDGSPFQLQTNIPNLKRITFTTNGGLYRYKDAVTYLLAHATALESISVTDTDDEYTAVGTNLRLVKWLKEAPGSLLATLTTLRLDSINTQGLKHLMEMSLRRTNPLLLKTLVIRLNCCASNCVQLRTLFRNFLATQHASLKELDIEVRLDVNPFDANDDMEENPSPIIIPRMEALRVLDFTLCDNEGYLWDHPVTKLYEEDSLANNFPNLKHFSSKTDALNLLAIIGVRVEEYNVVAHHGVKKITLAENCFRTDDINLRQVFPLVEHLTVMDDSVVTDLGVRLFWSTWPLLTSLELHYTNQLEILNLDELLTGIPRSMVEVAKHNMRKSKRPMTLEKARALHKSYKIHPGLSDLPHLKKFVLEAHGQFEFTDAGVYLGLARASPELQHIDITLVWKWAFLVKNTISKDCKEFLRAIFGPCFQINITNTSDESEEQQRAHENFRRALWGQGSLIE